MKTLERFWQWCDAEKPSRELFEDKSGNGGPLSLEAQEAINAAVDVSHAYLEDCNCLVSMRPVVKDLSFSIFRARQHAVSQEVNDELDALNQERAIELDGLFKPMNFADLKARFDNNNLELAKAYRMTHIRGDWGGDDPTAGDVLTYDSELGLRWEPLKK